ncbi:MAG: hypothetical protein C4K58_03915 [Flavobacteriaceae bacterium]|nr:MAG: hypothetical protein C4K58_03915 [Flavobacteriaceae bacterium]
MFWANKKETTLNFKETISRDTEQNPKLKNYHIPLQKILDSLGIDKKSTRLFVSKSNYVLSVKKGESILKTYPVVFGTNPVDDKRQEGDRCTPEGVFRVKAKYPHKSWSKFIWFDYPNKESYKKFDEAKRLGKIPQDATIGGEVGIHGVPKGHDNAIDQRNNWTWGCISLKNKDVDEIYNATFEGMKIEIIH